MEETVPLGVTCPRCHREILVHGGLAASQIREAVRLRAAETGVSISCEACGCLFRYVVHHRASDDASQRPERLLVARTLDR